MRVYKRLIELKHCINILKKADDITKPTVYGKSVIIQALETIFDILNTTLTGQEKDQFIEQ